MTDKVSSNPQAKSLYDMKKPRLNNVKHGFLVFVSYLPLVLVYMAIQILEEYHA
ncbi:hypothetical protein BC781_103482 [Sediminitomix flava]|uniref:Uncharacterized protein n=1 Tax=Sediminitomix flava TaxID=379075 RepID=A0A315ZA70_SEDFL|nr:hypothetical protein BC781_103482 [Sediminitomix flava]